jgi:hypothetical protein
MNQGQRLVLFLLVFLSPTATLVYVSAFEIREAPSDHFPIIASIALISLLVSVLATLSFLRIFDAGAKVRFVRIGWSNCALCIFDLCIFALLIYGRRLSPGICIGSKCSLYPVIWLALAWMHFCYSITCLLITLRVRPKEIGNV